MTVSALAPNTASDVLPGHRGSRARILLTLKHLQPQAAKEIAASLGLSLNAVRHHLRELETAGLICYERQYRGVGAPPFAYRLTPGGEAIFPRRYEGPLTQLLDHVLELGGRAAAARLLEGQFVVLETRLKSELEGASDERRREIVANALREEGYMPEWRAHEGGMELVTHNCPIRVIAERMPEVCAAEARFLAAAMGTRVERRAHVLQGCPACEYRFADGPEPPSGSQDEIDQPVFRAFSKEKA